MLRLSDRAARLRDVGILVVIAAVSVAALKPPLHDYLFTLPWTGFGAVLPHTLRAAIAVWTFWCVSAVILGGLLLRSDPDLGLLDAVLGGFAGVWIFAYVGGNALGPIGLFRSWTIWTLLAAGAFWLWRTPPKIVLHHPSTGLKLAFLTFALVAPGLCILQLGSPVPPYMDIFATPASAQRIMTFGLYLPFDNDPYGYWHVPSQLPGLELFYALLGLGSGTSLAVLADTGAIVPMAGFLTLATYRLGKAIAGDVAGGFASLLLFATILFRVLPYGHGRSVAFALLAVGLAFFLDERRSTTRMTLGALALATAIASHAINGALAMAAASMTVLFWLLSGEVRATVAGFGVLAGASLVALPTVAIGLQVVLPYPVLPVTQMLGVLLIGVSARRLHARAVSATGSAAHAWDRATWPRWGLALVAIYVLLRHPQPWMGNGHHERFPLLVYGGGLGLALMLWSDGFRTFRRGIPVSSSQPRRLLLTPVASTVVLCVVVEHYSQFYAPTFTDPRLQIALLEWFYKIDYWYPYILLFPTAYLAAVLYYTLSPRVTVFVVLALLFFPWRDRVIGTYDPLALADPNYFQHSIAEGWALNLATGKGGYWGSTRDRRWAQGEAEFELAEVLRGEIAAGRITPSTHIVHLGPFTYLYKDNLLFSVYTGINDDLYMTNFVFDRAGAGSRLRPIEEVRERLAQRPPYVAIHTRDDSAPENIDPTPFAGELPGYTEIFNRDGVRLLRNDSPDARDAGPPVPGAAGESGS